MSSEITTQAVRLALGIQELQARVASLNIANASKPDARAMRIDFGAMQGVLQAATHGQGDGMLATGLKTALQGLSNLTPETTSLSIRPDDEVGNMVAANLSYQALSEALSRHFGLMRLATSGRS